MDEWSWAQAIAILAALMVILATAMLVPNRPPRATCRMCDRPCLPGSDYCEEHYLDHLAAP